MKPKCDIEVKKSNGSIGEALAAARDLDGFILYKNTHPLKLTDKQKLDLLSVNRAKDLKGIGIYTDSGILVAYEDTYFILKKYIVDYALSDDFMGVFRILYGDDEEGKAKFKALQTELRDRTDKFFHIIEKSKIKPTVQEYFFRLIRLVRDDEYNDVKLFLALFPTHRDVLKDADLFEEMFNVRPTNPEDFLKIRQFLSKKAGIYETVPEFRAGKRNKGQSYTSHTYYSDLPGPIKKYYFEKKFPLPEGLYITDLSKAEPEKLGPGNYIYVTNEDFLKFSIKDQKKLFKAIFEAYKLAEPNNAKELEKSIMHTINTFALVHGGRTFVSGLELIYKRMTNPEVYAFMMSMYLFPAGYIALLALNSFLHLPRYISSKIKGLKFNGDFGDFCETLGIFDNDIKFWRIINEGFKEGELKNSGLYILTAVKRQMHKLADAQFFNVADTLMTSFYRRGLVEEYISTKYPHINSFNEFIGLLSFMGKDKRDAEVKKLVKYVDDKMYKRYNNSADQHRYITLSPIVPFSILGIKLGKNTRDFLQEIANVASSTWHFYRRYMESYNDSVMGTIKGGRKGHSQKQVRELFEQFYGGEKEWAEVADELDEAFGNNQDLEFLINTAIYSALVSSLIFKNDIHGNGRDEEYVDMAVLANEYFDLYKLMFFPIEAWERTTLGMFIVSTFDAISLDVGLEDNANLIGVYNYKTAVKQSTKSLWILKGLAKLASDYYHNGKYDWAELSWKEKKDRARKDFTSSIHGFGYYLKDDIERQGFEQYTPKTQTAWLKEVFGIRDYSTKMFDEINKKGGILEVENRGDFFSNYFVYNTPFLSEIEIGGFSNNQGFYKATKELYNSDLYHSVFNGRLPDNTTDEEYYVFYNMMTKFNPSNLDQIGLSFLVDRSWTDDDGKIAHDYNKEAVEKIRHDLMLENVDKNLLKEAVKLLTTTDKNYQGQALSALLYLEADTPGAGQKVLGYIASHELMQNVYFSGKYGYFKKQEDGTYSFEDEARRQKALRQESINIARKYFDYEFMLDKEIWAQAGLKLFKDSDLSIKNYIKDTNANGTAKLGIYTEPIQILEEKLKRGEIEYMSVSNEAMEAFLLQAYATMAAAEGNPDGYKINNFATKLLSTTGRKGEDGRLTKDGAKSILYSMNSVFEMLDNMGISDVEKVVIKAGTLIPHDQILSTVMEGMTDEEIKNDPTIQYSLRFLWGTARDINKLGDRVIAETVQKEQVGLDPSDISLSWVTKSKGKNKNGYSNWKQYYNKNQYLYDQVKYMTGKYHKYYNYLYTPKKTNAGSYYSKRERDLKAFGPGLATIKGNGSSRRRDNKQQKPGGSLTQRWGKARPFTNRGDLDKIPDRKTKPKNRRTRAYAIGSKLRNKLIPGRRRYIKARQRDIPTIS